MSGIRVDFSEKKNELTQVSDSAVTKYKEVTFEDVSKLSAELLKKPLCELFI